VTPRFAAVAAVLLLAGCSPSGATGPWITMPSAVAHTNRYFAIAAGETHGAPVGETSPACNGCHYDKAATPPGPSPTFKVFTCTNCHVLLRSGIYHDDPEAVIEAWHATAGVTGFAAAVAAANVAGVAPLDAACLGCHPRGIAVDHAARFLLPHQDAAGTSVAKCADCHRNPADRIQLGCSSCHPHDLPASDAAHARVPDYLPNGAAPAAVQAASIRCARCHEDGKIPVRVAAHAAGAGGFAIGSGAHAGSAGGACLTCHDQYKTAPRAFVADFTATNCVGCHDVVVAVTAGTNVLHGSAASLAGVHGSVAGFNALWTGPQLSIACLGCHADGAGGAPSYHEQLFPRGTGTKHAGISCTQCHGSGARNDLTQMACYGCHRTDAGFARAHAAPLNHLSSGQNRYTLLDLTGAATCLRCHAPSTINPASALVPITQAGHSRGESGNNTGNHLNVGCLDCHNAQRTVGGANPGAYQAQDFTKRSCLTCHTSNNP
jgi:predicted CXXCH cytochrome family protein